MPIIDLVNVRGASWVLPGPTNIGFFETKNGVFVIDTGNDKESGRKINKILVEKGWKLQGIINTHSNADHIGGNDYLQRMANCPIFSSKAEKAFIESPEIEKSFLWGGYPVKELSNKFFEAKPSTVSHIVAEGTSTLEGMSIIALPGHFFGMIGVFTHDDVFYLGDCMFGERTLDKYKIPFIYDVKEYKKTIEKVKTIQARYYVMSHGDIQTRIDAAADKNLEVVDTVENEIEYMLGESKTFEEVLARICDTHGIKLDIGQYALVGSTIRSFLSYLYNENRINIEIRDNVMYWIKQSNVLTLDTASSFVNDTP